MHKTLTFFVTSLAFIISSNSLAQQINDSATQQDWMTRNQQNIIEEKNRQREFETIAKDHELKIKEAEQEKKSQIKVRNKSDKCFVVREMHLIGADTLDQKTITKLTTPFIGRCFDQQLLNQASSAVTNYYHERGHITTQTKVPKQNLQNGIFELQVIEGKLEKISLGKNSLKDHLQKLSAFGKPEGNILNVADINQGIYQMNRLQSNAALMKIEPGKNNGDSNVVIENTQTLPAYLSIGRDNLGNDFSGVQRTSFSGSFDNILSLNDNINLSYTSNMHNENRDKDSLSLYGSISIPFKYNTFSYDYSHSQFNGKLQTQNGTPVSNRGYSSQRRFTLDRVLLNQNKLRISANTSLTTKDGASYQNDHLQVNSVRKLSIANVSIAFSSYFNNNNSIYFKPSYARGLKILNATKDSSNMGPNTPKSQFEVFKFYANFSSKFTLPQINLPLLYNLEFDSQFAQDTLFGSEHFGVGGYYSVRGFRENYLSQDSGYYLRNKLGFSIGDLLAPFFNPEIKNNLREKSLFYLNHLRLEPFYDYGYSRNKFYSTDGRLSGAGFKSIFNSTYFNASLTYSQSVNKSRLLDSDIKEDRVIYFEISTSCCS